MSATSVEVYRIAVYENGEPIKPNGRRMLVYGAAILSGPHKQSEGWLHSLQQTLAAMDTDQNLNSPEMAKGCDPMPGVMMRFIGSSDSVDMLICYECKMLAFARDASKDLVSGWSNFDTKSPTLVRLAKEALPMDKEIQGLGKSR